MFGIKIIGILVLILFFQNCKKNNAETTSPITSPSYTIQDLTGYWLLKRKETDSSSVVINLSNYTDSSHRMHLTLTPQSSATITGLYDASVNGVGGGQPNAWKLDNGKLVLYSVSQFNTISQSFSITFHATDSLILNNESGTTNIKYFFNK